MITKINTDIPNNTNKKIIETLYNTHTWRFGVDNTLSKNPNIRDSGFMLFTYDVSNEYHNNDILNTYAQTIFDMIEKKTFMKFKKIDRIFWNWYHPGSIMEFHQDKKDDNKFSIIYNLHDNDGGTDIKINDKNNFYKSVESEALLFPSKLYHRGVAPKENINRFSLNIVLEI
jgi:hypothetical protein|tara:strand:+ start:30 stop:545 length:516 start_codon:yes stop_codon:yes gene_type:complete